MPPTKDDQDWNGRDMYFRHPTEGLLFRWDHKNKVVYFRSIGRPEQPKPLHHSDKYFNDAICMGGEISMMEYLRAGE